MTVEGAPHLQRRAPAGVRLREPLRQERASASSADGPRADDGGGAAVPLRRDHQDGQPAERGHVEEVEEIYNEAWKLGLKAVALYRDGCKLSQPLVHAAKTRKNASEETVARRPRHRAKLAPPPRCRASPARSARLHAGSRVGGHKVYLRTGEYEDGTLGEIFIDMHKEGAAFRSHDELLRDRVSMGLQYGVPLEDFVDQFTFTRFEPQGLVDGHANISALYQRRRLHLPRARARVPATAPTSRIS